MKLKHYFSALLLSLFAFSASAASKAPTEQVWQEHIQAWVDRDLDAISVHYDKDSLMIVNNIMFKGPKEIREVFAYLFHRFDNGSNVIDPAIVDDRTIYITWNFTPSEQKEAIYGTDTFFVEDGIIKVQTIASKLYQKPTLLYMGGKEKK
jgi:hypothetical protein